MMILRLLLTESGSFVDLLQVLEATLSDSKKKYGDKVNALLSAWGYVANYISAASSEDIQSLIEWVHRWVPVISVVVSAVEPRPFAPVINENSGAFHRVSFVSRN